MRIAGSGFYNKKKRSRLIWVAAGMACMAAGCCAAFYMQVSLRVPTEAREAMAMDELAKKVAITFDDGPNPDYTEELLSGLKERGVSATFFLLGKEVEQYPEIVKKIHEGGHLGTGFVPGLIAVAVMAAIVAMITVRSSRKLAAEYALHTTNTNKKSGVAA